jgi:uncharacterized membrane protein YeaQ/YmgE (transglycosylase-associated protein family)
VGGWLASVIGFAVTSSLGSFLMAIVGAIVLVGMTRFFVREVV